jgi:HK97 family phage major capsid protein
VPRVRPKHTRTTAREADAAFSRAVTAQQIDPAISPEPYGPHSTRSWFADIAWATATPQARRNLPPPPPTVGSPQQAERRLRAVSVLEQRSHREREQRDLTTTVTAGGNFVPPAYIGEAFADGVRSVGVLTDILPTEPLIERGMVLTTPRITTGASVAPQATENTAISETDIAEGLVTSPVGTIAGQQDLSQQLFDRSEAGAVAGAEVWLARELGKALGSRRDQQLLDGTASAGQVRGLTQVGSIGTTAFTDASPTQQEGFVKILQAAGELATNGGWPEASAILIHPRRLAWFANWRDTATGIPAVIPWPAPLFPVPSIPVTQGAGTNEDYVLVLRREALPVYVGPIQFMASPEVLSGTLTVRVTAWQYIATLFGRMPLAINKVSGTGFAGVTYA